MCTYYLAIAFSTKKLVFRELIFFSAPLGSRKMVGKPGGSPNPANQGSTIPWERVDSSEEEAVAASQRLLDGEDGGKTGNGKTGKKNKKKKQQKLKNGIELEQDQTTGCSMGVTEPENIREIISKDEATTGSR